MGDLYEGIRRSLNILNRHRLFGKELILRLLLVETDKKILKAGEPWEHDLPIVGFPHRSVNLPDDIILSYYYSDNSYDIDLLLVMIIMIRVFWGAGALNLRPPVASRGFGQNEFTQGPSSQVIAGFFWQV